jgi:YidC/Oxa1 family membrane protein insertase
VRQVPRFFILVACKTFSPMEQRRLIPLVIFILSLVMLWTHWIEYNQPAATTPPATIPSTVSTPESPALDDSVPAPARTVTPPAAAPTSSAAPRVKVETDVIRAEISAEGGSIVRLELLKHRSSENPENSYVIFDDGAAHIFEAQSGFLLNENLPLPNHRTLFELPDGNLALADGQDKLVVRLKAPAANDVSVTKVLTFTWGSYLIDVAYEIHNESADPLVAQAYFQFLRDGKPA